AGCGLGGDPRRLALRLSAVDNARDLWWRDGGGRREAALSRALGGRGEHRRGLGDDGAGRGRDRRRDLRPHADLRHGRARPGDRLGDARLAHRGGVRTTGPAGPEGQPDGGDERLVMLATVIDTKALLDVVWVSLAAGV